VLAGDLIKNQLKQIEPFKPGFTLGEVAKTIEKTEDNFFIVTTDKGTQHKAPVVAIAGGLGVFEPRKPPIDNLLHYENKGVEYIIKDPLFYKDKSVVIAGGGDSALDWTIYLANGIAKEVTLVHRNASFRGHLDSVQKVIALAEAGKINLVTEAEVTALYGEQNLTGVGIMHNTQGLIQKDCQHFIPLFGLSPKLGPIADWGLDIEKHAIKVDTYDYQTNIPGIYAIGDVNTYPGKLKLILCGYHEATLMCQSAFARIHPEKKHVLKYTTVNGIQGF
jgi:thioredoxin reductase (NADPH)